MILFRTTGFEAVYCWERKVFFLEAVIITCCHSDMGQREDFFLRRCLLSRKIPIRSGNWQCWGSSVVQPCPTIRSPVLTGRQAQWHSLLVIVISGPSQPTQGKAAKLELWSSVGDNILCPNSTVSGRRRKFWASPNTLA